MKNVKENKSRITRLANSFEAGETSFSWRESSDSGFLLRKKVFLRACEEAIEASETHEYAHGCVIFSRGRIIASGHNAALKTHPEGSGYYSTIHAETSAIIKARKIVPTLAGLSILVVRLGKNDRLMLSRPCPDCMRRIDSYDMIPIWTDGKNQCKLRVPHMSFWWMEKSQPGAMETFIRTI